MKDKGLREILDECEIGEVLLSMKDVCAAHGGTIEQ